MFGKASTGFGGTAFEDEVDKDDISPAGVRLRVPHENCSRTFELLLSWKTLYDIYHLRPTRVDGCVTQLLPADLPEFVRIAFLCPACEAHYRGQQYDRDRASLITAKTDVTATQALELLRAGKTRRFI